MKRFLPYLFLFGLLIEGAAAQSTIFLVRHAERADAGSDGGQKAEDPDLAEIGRVRAASLAKILIDAEITAVFATEFKRTQQTADPVALAAGVDVTIVPAKDTPALVAKLREARGNVLVVAHSNSLPEIIRGLGVESSVTIRESDYDNLFVCIPGGPLRFLKLHYQ